MHRNAISRWEQGDFLPENKRMVLELTRLLKLNVLEARQFLEASFTALAPHWGIPSPRSVATTLSLSLQRVEKASAAAADLLRLCAFLYPDAMHIYEQQVGTIHSNTANCISTLATIGERQENDQQVEQGYLQALAILEQRLTALTSAWMLTSRDGGNSQCPGTTIAGDSNT